MTTPVTDTTGRADALAAGILELLRAVDEEAERLAPRHRGRAAAPSRERAQPRALHRTPEARRPAHAARAGGARPVVARSLGGACSRHARASSRHGSVPARRRPPRARAKHALDWAKAEALLHENTRLLFGPRPAARHVRIMVTAPGASEATAAWADEILKAGTDVLRINGAHETPEAWAATVSLFRSRAAALERKIRIFVDLPGPKLRGEIRGMQAGVLHLPRRKDRLGRTLAPTEVLLVARHARPRADPGAARVAGPPAPGGRDRFDGRRRARARAAGRRDGTRRRARGVQPVALHHLAPRAGVAPKRAGCRRAVRSARCRARREMSCSRRGTNFSSTRAAGASRAGCL